MEPFTRRC